MTAFGCIQQSIVIVPLYDTLDANAASYIVNQTQMQYVIQIWTLYVFYYWPELLKFSKTKNWKAVYKKKERQKNRLHQLQFNLSHFPKTACIWFSFISIKYICFRVVVVDSTDKIEKLLTNKICPSLRHIIVIPKSDLKEFAAIDPDVQVSKFLIFNYLFIFFFALYFFTFNSLYT